MRTCMISAREEWSMNSWQNYKALIAAAALLLLPLTACSADDEAQHLAVEPLIVHTAKGNVMFQVEVARSPEELERGLMYRKELPANKGMLFIFGEQRDAAFWMENTLIPLDMLFIKEDGKIVTIHSMAQPLDRTPIPSGEPVKAVLEIFGGESAKQGIKAGDTIDPSLLKTE